MGGGGAWVMAVQEGYRGMVYLTNRSRGISYALNGYSLYKANR